MSRDAQIQPDNEFYEDDEKIRAKAIIDNKHEDQDSMQVDKVKNLWLNKKINHKTRITLPVII